MSSLTIQPPPDQLDGSAQERCRAFVEALQAFRAQDGDFDEDPVALFGDMRQTPSTPQVPPK